MHPTCTLNIYNNNYSNSLMTDSNSIHDVSKCLTRNQSFTEHIIPSSQSTVCLAFIIPTLYFTVLYITVLVLLYISTNSSERIFASRNHGGKSNTLIKLNSLQLYYFIWYVPISNVISKISLIANR